jgi:superfamily II DNA or RNA helicase
MCLQANLKALKMMGQMSSDEERRVEAELESERCRILISTFKFLSEGFDYNPLNIIIPATPFRDPIRLEQAIGRTQRPTSYKRKSKYIDLVDSSGLLVNQFSTRCSELQDQDIPIFTYQL